VECFLCLEEAGVVTVGGDTQVIGRLDIVETNMSQEHEERHTAVTLNWVGLHWVASHDFRSDYQTK
jgi:hypothetical protein